ncbi:DUF302 domain-containing protein [Anaeromyxobacter paludicola]|uniref:DUF302 domain-containing protein n=1 Tax=Anaeromyxobacter paludicola TaxID=2918171 RepID=A0ABN6NA66_9BACT|nr:DUF302 domain-containing protein [Anaeromyxobacter paludicola]BDG09183.1 hypothetical protein AMPC_22960 [Anaeromyxobacter paludicola]
MATFSMKKTVGLGYEEALAKLPDLLKAEGFGVLTQIDVKDTLKQKLGVDFRRYRILGACNPALAHRALASEPSVGVMLPCNVVVFERDDGRTEVDAVDPSATMAAALPSLAPIAAEVRERLARVLAGLE